MCRNLIKENNKEYIYNSGRLVRVVEGNTLIQEIMYDETKDKYKPINLIVNGSREDLRYEGRRLIGIGNDISYEYDGEGRRISKTVKGNKEEYKYEGERLVKIIKEGREIEVLYDIKGEIVGLKNEEGYYYYRKDALGNIERIIDSTGKTIVKYEYSVWGELIEEKKIENKKIVEDNPYKYKSYYYDKESGLYYLKSRYYSASLHRFISLDQTEYMEIGSITGLNLYVYCGNDPVNMADSDGNSAVLIGLIIGAILLFTPVGGTVFQVVTSMLSYIGMAVASIFDEDIRNDMNAIGWNPFNKNEYATLNSSKVSFYKGVPVFRTASGGRSGSFGAIFLAKGSGIDSIHHERGHNWQLMMMGIANYGFMIGLPSWREWSTRQYYDRPWDFTADVFGGVTGRTHSQADINRGYWYLAVSSLFGPLGYLFLIGEY